MALYYVLTLLYSIYVTTDIFLPKQLWINYSKNFTLTFVLVDTFINKVFIIFIITHTFLFHFTQHHQVSHSTALKQLSFDLSLIISLYLSTSDFSTIFVTMTKHSQTHNHPCLHQISINKYRLISHPLYFSHTYYNISIVQFS